MPLKMHSLVHLIHNAIQNMKCRYSEIINKPICYFWFVEIWKYWSDLSYFQVLLVSFSALLAQCVLFCYSWDNLVENCEVGINRSRTFSQKTSAYIIVNSDLVFPITLQIYAQIYSLPKQHQKNKIITWFLISLIFLFNYSEKLMYFVNFPATGKKCMLYLLSSVFPLSKYCSSERDPWESFCECMRMHFSWTWPCHKWQSKVARQS